ncbi:MAG: replication-associated recombination protein A [Bacteroidota bacterium]|nr:replication-associated recombination protein A [Bacteroidota bacterium]
MTSLTTPLAERIRPTKIEEFIGQDHIVGVKGPIRQALKNKHIPSMIFWGPPGVGKTTLAEIITKELDRSFYTLSAINSGVKDLRLIIDQIKKQGLFGQKNAIVFIDEIHRFSKTQQDALLAAVEKGLITLIGATTENPSFEVIPALRSRCQIFVLEHHKANDLLKFIDKALSDKHVKEKNPTVKETNALIRISGGDARKLLNAFELCVLQLDEKNNVIDDAFVQNIIQQNLANYDKNGEMHYDVISAFIKSIRGSDPNAAIYWLARMVEGNEDPKFIARRLIISASEDIGLANPTALIMANNCFDAVQKIGWPEGRIILAQCTIYLALSPKSNSAYAAINKALEKVKDLGDLSIPLHLRNAPNSFMKDLGYGENYQYSHDHKNKLHLQEFLPETISGESFYKPQENPKEKVYKDAINQIWKGKYD